MKYFLMVVVLVAMVILSGCDGLSAKQRQQIEDSSVVLDAFVKEMEDDKTTRKQEQAWLRLMNQKLKEIAEAVKESEEKKAKTKRSSGKSRTGS